MSVILADDNQLTRAAIAKGEAAFLVQFRTVATVRDSMCNAGALRRKALG